MREGERHQKKNQTGTSEPPVDVALSLDRMASALQPGQDFPPEFYRSLSQFLQRDAAFRFLAPALQLTGHESVLDVGCGEGKVTVDVLLPKVPKGAVLGLDINPAAIQEASKSFLEGRHNLQFLIGDVESMSSSVLEESKRNSRIRTSFDLICSNFTLHWPRELATAFQEMRKLLAPDGRMVHLFSGSDPFPELFGAAHEVVEMPRWRGYFSEGHFRHPALRSFKEVTRALETAGFDRIEGGVQPVWHTFPNPSVLAAWMGKMPRPFITRLPESEHAAFGREVAAAYERNLSNVSDYPSTKPGKIAVRHNMILFSATPRFNQT